LSLQTRCTLNFQQYPFDNQTCNFTIIPWPVPFIFKNIVYTVDRGANNQSNANHSVWNIGNLNYYTSYLVGYNGIPPITPVITVVFPFTRKSLYYVINTIIPCEILNLIMMLAFFIPFANQIALSE
jgi:hypothetical protein